MFNNEVRIKGRAYRYEVKNTSGGKKVCTFGLSFYDGKDKEGKARYTFVNCKGFTDYDLKDKQEIVVKGNLSGYEYKKEGLSIPAFQILVDTIENVETQDMPF